MKTWHVLLLVGVLLLFCGCGDDTEAVYEDRSGSGCSYMAEDPNLADEMEAAGC